MERLSERQAAFNESSCHQWELFAEHRRRLTEVLGGDAGVSPSIGGGRLCVLGAGNANDLDLPTLLKAYREVCLIDIDSKAIELGALRQGVAEHPGLRLLRGIDLTAATELISGWSPLSSIGRADLDALANWPTERVGEGLTLHGGFDRVASTCLLSQLWESATHSLGQAHARRAAVERALQIGHLRLLATLTAPGGEAVLVSEVVSADTLPDLANHSREQLAEILPRLLRDGNHFRGGHPLQLIAAIADDPVIAPRVERVHSILPWRWRLHDRIYLVSGVRLRIKPR